MAAEKKQKPIKFLRLVNEGGSNGYYLQEGVITSHEGTEAWISYTNYRGNKEHTKYHILRSIYLYVDTPENRVIAKQFLDKDIEVRQLEKEREVTLKTMIPVKLE